MQNKIQNLPKHIGFILDGNGRWATARGMPRNYGHQKGLEALKKCVNGLLNFKIPCASVFAFSTENWKRSKEEVDGIFNLLNNYLIEELENLQKNGVKINFFGDLSVFSGNLRYIINNSINTTKNNNKLILNICLNYGGRADIIRAVNNLINSDIKKIDEKEFGNNLYSGGLPDIDLLIRTGGEQRLSNFMIYQLAYSELYFIKTYWPDFNEKKLKKALKVFSKRKRRYGGY